MVDKLSYEIRATLPGSTTKKETFNMTSLSTKMKIINIKIKMYVK